MDARVVRELGVERGGEDAPLAYQDRLLPEAADDLHAGPGIDDPRRADEHALERLPVALELDVGLEARHLAPVGVPLDHDIEQPEVGAVEEDHAGARSEERSGEAGHRLLEAAHAHQPADGGGLSARDDEPVQPTELFGPPHLDNVGAEPPQHRRVLAEVALDRQDADARRVAHLP